ncbi:MAG TPA: antibiotic biosynthesis monooxygenase [Chitinophagales bacterium]|nr:antibiotic biosynthesis monooxygenase [Chitinophagales bacterium]HMU69018.1 antibiotic biosynthesis monooxygenase [Chitinophagales bacterium]HMX03739.1 antibiotic biosynthesis monooxygenase [Chitinophagales bacterium]HMZ89176.1 antibiotic biosynthesis monooxygenase [Chitinophagales bacterium]HNA56830.1 antibiotic biosynthesis monooxygenase [Chitinophagales bacterium]
MIIRIVKMTFDHRKVEDFLRIFSDAQHKIEAFPGCKGVDLTRDVLQSNIFMTISIWENLASLDEYRKSELFKTTWSATKLLFSERPDAWSVEKIR